MITLAIILLTIIILIAFIVIAIATFGAGCILVFGDVIVCIIGLVLLAWLIFRKR